MGVWEYGGMGVWGYGGMNTLLSTLPHSHTSLLPYSHTSILPHSHTLLLIPMSERPIKVLLGKLGLDGHDRGIKVIAKALRDAGMEVIYLGMRLTPDQVAQAAIHEDVDVIGVSLLSGAHMRLVPKLTGFLKEKGVLDEMLVVLGGTIPDQDIPKLKESGVDGIFPVGTSLEEIIHFIQTHIKRKIEKPA